MSDLPKQLRIKAGMISMGERIAWGSDSALMEQAADLIEQLQQRNGELAATVERFIELREHLPNVRQWVIEFEKLVHKTPKQNLNAVKRSVAMEAFDAGEEHGFRIADGGNLKYTNSTDYASQRYPDKG